MGGEVLVEGSTPSGGGGPPPEPLEITGEMNGHLDLVLSGAMTAVRTTLDLFVGGLVIVEGSTLGDYGPRPVTAAPFGRMMAFRGALLGTASDGEPDPDPDPGGPDPNPGGGSILLRQAQANVFGTLVTRVSAHIGDPGLTGVNEAPGVDRAPVTWSPGDPDQGQVVSSIVSLTFTDDTDVTHLGFWTEDGDFIDSRAVVVSLPAGSTYAVTLTYTVPEEETP